MAKIKLASYLQSLSGSIGNMVFYNKHGREYARVYVMPANPDTEGQRLVRRTFGDAVRSWQGLSREEKDSYNRLARKRPMSGYNLFISRFMKRNASRCGGFAVRQTAGTDLFPFIKDASLSVSAPFRLKNCSTTPILPGADGPGMG